MTVVSDYVNNCFTLCVYFLQMAWDKVNQADAADKSNVTFTWQPGVNDTEDIVFK